MIRILIPVGIVLLVLVAWMLSTQRKFIFLEENINNAMAQIGVQMESRFDALHALWALTKGYAQYESETIVHTMQSYRKIDRESTPADVAAQEAIAHTALGQMQTMIEEYPDLKASAQYKMLMDSINRYENFVRTSRMVYNDCVTKWNRMVRMFPSSLLAGSLGFGLHEYLQTEKSQMPEF